MVKKGKGFGKPEKMHKKSRRKSSPTAGKGFGLDLPSKLANLKVIEVDDADILPSSSFDFDQKKNEFRALLRRMTK